MKRAIAIFVIATLLIISVGCVESGEEPEDKEEMGTLVFQGKAGTGGTRYINRECEVIDIRPLIVKMEVSEGDMVHNATDDLEWHTVYSGNTEKGLNEFSLSIDLPPGNYKNIPVTQRNKVIWVVSYNGTTYNFVDYNNKDYPAEAILPPGINNLQGGWKMNDDNTFNWTMQYKETMGGFFIKSGQVTNVVMRCNIIGLEWVDYNEDEVFNNDDRLDNWTTTPGTTTMTDYIIEYE